MKEKSPADVPCAEVRAEAAAWVARLHGSSRSRAMEEGFQRWLKADAAHARAFELATEAWEIGGTIPRGALTSVADTSMNHTPRRTAKPYLALAAALSVVVTGALVYLRLAEPAVSTAVGEQRILTLADGSRIFLNTDTRLVVNDEPRRRHIRLDNGEALFDVAEDRTRPFVVTAGDREVVALGTSFVVRRDDQQLAVTLLEGKVAVAPVPSGDDGSPVPEASTVLLPGQRLVLAESEAPKLDQPSLESITAWRRGEIILDKTRLQEAIAEMNRYSELKLVIEEPEIADIRVSGIFRIGDSARFAHAVAQTYHLNVDRDGRRIVISAASGT